LTGAHVRAAVAFLSRAPYDNVYLQWLIESGQAAPNSTMLVARNDGGDVCGIAYEGAQIVIAANDDATIDCFAGALGKSGAPRMIVAPRPIVERFWTLTERKFPKPSAIRESQPVFALVRADLERQPPEPGVARATRPEADEIVREAARMASRELLGSDFERIDPAFRAHTEARIEAGRVWRYRLADGRLVFQCDIGSFTAQTAQLQGVWTPLAARSRGHATRGLAAICDRLLDEHPSLCLFVNDFNHAAIALYERVGFKRSGEFASILF
jgi:RimJ/RimL family protein N-acetyltransferase